MKIINDILRDENEDEMFERAIEICDHSETVRFKDDRLFIVYKGPEHDSWEEKYER